MSNNSSAAKKKFNLKEYFKNFKLTKNWIILIVVVACLGAFLGGCFIVRAVTKNPGAKVFDAYLSAAKSQKVEAMAKTIYEKNSDEYKKFVADYKGGKTAYSRFISGATEEEEIDYLRQTEVLGNESDLRDNGLRLSWEQTLAKNVKGYTYEVVRQDKDQVVLSVTLELKNVISAAKLPGKYQRYVSRNVTSTHTVKIIKGKDGKWRFATDFRLLSGQGIEATWTASYEGGLELKRVNPNDTNIIKTTEGEGDQKKEKVTLVVSDIAENIVSIGMFAFEGLDKITHIVIPNNLKNISRYAFSGCSALENVSYADGTGVKLDSGITVDEGAFFGCAKLTSFVLPTVNKIVPNYLFAGCTALSSFAMSDQITSIGYYSFYGCGSLATVTIPATVTEIGSSAFENCLALSTISADNALPAGVVRTGSNVFKNCKALTNITLSPKMTEIGTGFFEDCDKLTSVGDLPEKLVSIGKNAFKNTAIGAIEIPVTVKKLGEGAFLGSSVTSVTWGTDSKGKTGIRTIGERAFYTCKSLVAMELPDTIQGIGKEAFIGCERMRSVMVNFSTSTVVGEKVFAMSHGIPKIYIKENVNTFKRNWGLMALDLYSQDIINGNFAMIDEVRENAQGGASIIEKVLVQYLGSEANVELNPAITRLGDGAFSYSTTLETITNFSNLNINDIGIDVFAGCENLKYDVYGNRTVGELKYIGNWLIDGSAHIASTLDLLDGVYNLQGGSGGGLIRTRGIAAGAFIGTEGLKAVKFNNELEYISKNAFDQCDEMVTATFDANNALTTIGDRAFFNCGELDYIDLPASVTEIGDGAFDYCNNLRFVKINSTSPTKIGANVFLASDVLKIYVKNYTTHGHYATNENWNDPAIKGLIYDANIIDASGEFAVVTVGDEKIFLQYLISDNLSFDGIPSDVVTIGAAAFAKSPLEAVKVPATVKKVERLAFYDCSYLRDVTFLATGSSTKVDSLVYLGDYAFMDVEGFSENNAGITFEATAPQAGFTMGTNPFDSGMFRKIKVGSRTNYTANEFWAQNADFLKAANDPQLTIVIYVDPTITDEHNNTVEPGENTFDNSPGTVIDLIAKPDKENGFDFEGWYDEAGQKLSSNKYTYTAGVSETITAKFERKQVIVYLDTDFNDLGGTITINDGSFEIITEGNTKIGKTKVDAKEDFTIKVELKDEYEFLGWFIDGSSNPLFEEDGTTIATEYTFTADNVNIEIEAKFNKVKEWVVIKKPANGTITVTSTDVIVLDETTQFKALLEIGQKLTLTAVANEGYDFKHWTYGTTTSTDISYTFEMLDPRAHIEITAVFELDPTPPAPPAQD